MVKYDNTHYNLASTVENYDLCRHIPDTILTTFAREIIGLASKSSGSLDSRILEEGAGNGRILIPTIKESARQGRGDQFYAIDKSRLMLDDLQKRLTPEQKAKCHSQLGDIQEPLPYEDESFNCIYTFAVYHILGRPKQALDEMVKKLKQNGYFVFGKEFTQVFHGTERRIEYGDSEDFTSINLVPIIQDFFQEYHALRDQHGVPFRDSGVLYSNPALVINHLTSKGFDHSVIRGAEFAYTKPHTFRQMLSAFLNKNITTFGTDIPDEIRKEIHRGLFGWCEKRRVSLDNVINVPAHISLNIFSKR